MEAILLDIAGVLMLAILSCASICATVVLSLFAIDTINSVSWWRLTYKGRRDMAVQHIITGAESMEKRLDPSFHPCDKHIESMYREAIKVLKREREHTEKDVPC